MYRNIKVEAEHNELILENEYGDKVIIPANKRRWVQQKMKEGCNGCIDNLVSSLPTVEDYASDGALYPGGIEGFEGELNNENTTPTDPPINVYEKAPRKGARLIYDENDNIIGEETHRMGWGTMDDKFVVTPTLFQDDKGEWYEGDLREGIRRGESWTFDTQEEAEAFAAGSWKQYANDNAVNPIITLPEVTVVPKENRYSEYRKQYIRENPFNINEWVQERFDNPTGRQKIQKINPQKFRQELRQAGIKRRNEEINKAVIERLYNENPQGEMFRGEWIDSFTEKEQQLLLTDPRFQTTIWQDFKQGLEAAAASTPGIAATQILESKDLSVKEKIQLLEQYTDNPVITNLLESFKMLSPLDVPAKAVQSVYKDDYSLGDALAGKKNDAGMIEDIVTNPLNLLNGGMFGTGVKKGTKIASSIDDVLKNLPKLKTDPVKFDNIEDLIKGITIRDRKNMTIMKEGDKYFKQLNNPESLKRLKEFGDEYGIDLMTAYKKAAERWEYGTNIGKNTRFQVAGEEIFKGNRINAMGTSTLDKEGILYEKLGIKGDLSDNSVNYINIKSDIRDYPTIVWHELSHDINKFIIDSSPKLRQDISDIFVKNLDEVNKEKVLKARKIADSLYKSDFEKSNKDLIKSDKTIEEIIEGEFYYVTRPTETWAFLSTNLRQNLKNTGIIKDYNEILTTAKLEQAIKNENTVFSRFEPYIKDKNKFIELFNKMTLAIAPAALFLQSQQGSEPDNKKQ